VCLGFSDAFKNYFSHLNCFALVNTVFPFCPFESINFSGVHYPLLYIKSPFTCIQLQSLHPGLIFLCLSSHTSTFLRYSFFRFLPPGVLYDSPTSCGCVTHTWLAGFCRSEPYSRLKAVQGFSAPCVRFIPLPTILRHIAPTFLPFANLHLLFPPR